MPKKERKIIAADEENVARFAPGSAASAATRRHDEASGRDVDVTASESKSRGDGASPRPSDDEIVPDQAEDKAQTGRKETVESLRAQIADYKDKLLRARAECANISKRLHQQYAESLKLAGMDLARDLLTVVDSLDRTLGSLEASAPDDPIVQGVELIAGQFLKTLKDHGVEPIDAVGKPFDPTLHEAILQDRDADLPPNTVTRELQRGYKMRERVVRPARVAVAAEAEEPEAGKARSAEEDRSPEAGDDPSDDASQRRGSNHADV